MLKFAKNAFLLKLVFVSVVCDNRVFLFLFFVLAPGVNVQCKSENMTIIIPKSLLFDIDREHLRLLDTSCKAAENNTHFSLTTPLTGCNTTSRHTPTAIVYSNAVLDMPVAVKSVVTRVLELEIQFSCFYSKRGVVSSVVWKASNRKLVFSNEGEGNLTLSLDMFPNKTFVSPYTKRDFPVAVILRNPLFFEVSVISDDKQLSIRADRCYATPTQDRMNPLKYEFIKQGYDKKIHYSTMTFFKISVFWDRWWGRTCQLLAIFALYLIKVPEVFAKLIWPSFLLVFKVANCCRRNAMSSSRFLGEGVSGVW